MTNNLKEQFNLMKGYEMWKPETIVVGTKTVTDNGTHETYMNTAKKGLKTQIRGYLKDGYTMQYDNNKKILYLGSETEELKVYYAYIYYDIKDLF